MCWDFQSEKRARDLWAQFAEEEKRCQELTKIVKNLLPDPQLSQNQKPSRTRKVNFCGCSSIYS